VHQLLALLLLMALLLLLLPALHHQLPHLLPLLRVDQLPWAPALRLLLLLLPAASA
jgi:hypothetical protein